MNEKKDLQVETQIVQLGNTQILCVTLKGRLVFENTADLTNELLDDLKNSIHGVVIDLSEIDYVDSSGMGFLASLVIKLVRRNIKLVLAGLNSQAKILLRQTHLSNLFIIYDTKEQALALLSNQ